MRIVEADDGDIYTVVVNYPPRCKSEIPYYINGELSVFCATLASGMANENKVFAVAVRMSQAAIMDKNKINYNQIITIERILQEIYDRYKDSYYNAEYDLLYNSILDDIDIIYSDIALIIKIN